MLMNNRQQIPHPMNKDTVFTEADEDNYQTLTDLWFDALWDHQENPTDETVERLIEYGTRLASLENQWRYASYEKIRDGSAPNHRIR